MDDNQTPEDPTPETPEVQEPTEEVTEEVTEPSPQEEEALDNSKNPERTKEYIDGLKKEIEDLKAPKQEVPNVLDSLKPPPPPEPTPTIDPVAAATTQTDQEIIDSEGYIDNTKLNKALQTANEKAAKAAEEVTRVKEDFRSFEETQQTRNVHSKYPQLDPKNKEFNERMYDLVKNELIGQMMKGERDFMKAADKIEGLMTPSKEKQEREEQSKDAVDKKRQINATSKRAPNRESTATHQDLVNATQKNKPGALAERLKRAGH